MQIAAQALALGEVSDRSRSAYSQLPHPPQNYSIDPTRSEMPTATAVMDHDNPPYPTPADYDHQQSSPRALPEAFQSPTELEHQLASDNDDTHSPSQAHLPTALAAKGTKRGRKAQDPHQHIIRVECNSQHDLEVSLRQFLEDESHDRTHTLFEAALPVSAAFLVDYLPAGPGKSNSYKYGPAFAPAVGPAKDGHVARSMSVIEALEHTPHDAKERMRKQRAMSRALETIVEKVDGHRYAFHNEWLARDNDAYRFSYFCNDSLLNKDRTLGGVKKNNEGKGRLLRSCPRLLQSSRAI